MEGEGEGEGGGGVRREEGEELIQKRYRMYDTHVFEKENMASPGFSL